MRTLSLVAGVIAVGTLAALPFRRTEPLVDPEQPQGVATGPLGYQVEDDAMNGVMQWPDRPGFDPSLAWQPRPMTMDSSPSFEMPKMPESFPDESMRVMMPAPVRDRFAAAVPIAAPVSELGGSDPNRVGADNLGANGLLMPPVAQIEDRFIYTPAPPPQKSTRNSSFQSASVISHDETSRVADHQYIREPE